MIDHGRRWWVLGVLYVVYVCNVMDRHLLSILAQPIKHDLGLKDSQVGFLIGPSIAFLYAIAGIPMAYVADRFHRARFLAVCLALWSFATAMGGLATSVWLLALTRIGVSAAEAGGSPTSSSIISDYFQPSRRPLAMGIYASAATVGLMLSFGLGGLAGERLGWRWTLVLAGVPGIILALLVAATVREPQRGRFDAEVTPARPQPLIATMAMLWRNRLYRRAVVATGASNFCFHAIINWGPSLVMRKFYAGAGEAGVVLGVGIAVFGGAAAILFGSVIGKMAGKGLRRPFRVAAALMLLSGPLMFAAMFASRLDICILLMCAAYALQSFTVPLYWTFSQSLVPVEMRATATAVTLLALAMVGAGVAAPVIGAVSDGFVPRFGNDSLQYALAMATLANPLSAALFWWTARAARF